MASPQTMFEKIWRRHIVVDRDDGYTLLYVDRHLMHDGRFTTLKQVIEHYRFGIVERPSLSPTLKTIYLADADIDDLIAFMDGR